MSIHLPITFKYPKDEIRAPGMARTYRGTMTRSACTEEYTAGASKDRFVVFVLTEHVTLVPYINSCRTTGSLAPLFVV